MRLTIVVETLTVGKDYVFFDDLNLSGCGIPDDVRALQWNENSGHIEFVGVEPNQDIQELPSWALACVDVWQIKFDSQNAPPSPEQMIQINSSLAAQLLRDSDWTMLSDVALQNKDEWTAYRSILRSIAINPTADVVFPPTPQEQWQ
jgi:hypothetical protein